MCSLAYFPHLLMGYLPTPLVLQEMHIIVLKNEQKQGDGRKHILFFGLGMAYLIFYDSVLGHHG